MKTGCGTLIFILLINLTLGACSFSYVADNLLGLVVAFPVSFVGGFFFGQFTVPLAVLLWILKACGLHTPIFHG